ncbi:hypothetical protein [Pseudomonas alabamensis]|uniref:hypothetical protein n=1 Tax=Pseudomonas alabamensis TaxID=3064349 RepID=UPI000745BD79|nr:hypothetical protein APT63_11840 [Pseudomonas monteilii]
MTIDKAKLRAAAVDWGHHPMEITGDDMLELLVEIERIGADRKACWEEFKVQGRRLDQLKAENEALRDGANFRAIQSLRADCDALRKDAERYRWLNRQRSGTWKEVAEIPMNRTDAFIDAAMAKESSHG